MRGYVILKKKFCKTCGRKPLHAIFYDGMEFHWTNETKSHWLRMRKDPILYSFENDVIIARKRS